ncbi:hypothetical protein C8R47DRAFT_1082970 [Mycena vitilis]|nr:hypothetical protein C8R47DRAFT_1082970 [Mycena vitilis]
MLSPVRATTETGVPGGARKKQDAGKTHVLTQLAISRIAQDATCITPREMKHPRTRDQRDYLEELTWRATSRGPRSAERLKGRARNKSSAKKQTRRSHDSRSHWQVAAGKRVLSSAYRTAGSKPLGNGVLRFSPASRLHVWESRRPQLRASEPSKQSASSHFSIRPLNLLHAASGTGSMRPVKRGSSSHLRPSSTSFKIAPFWIVFTDEHLLWHISLSWRQANDCMTTTFGLVYPIRHPPMNLTSRAYWSHESVCLKSSPGVRTFGDPSAAEIYSLQSAFTDAVLRALLLCVPILRFELSLTRSSAVFRCSKCSKIFNVRLCHSMVARLSLQVSPLSRYSRRFLGDTVQTRQAIASRSDFLEAWYRSPETLNHSWWIRGASVDPALALRTSTYDVWKQTIPVRFLLGNEHLIGHSSRIQRLTVGPHVADFRLEGEHFQYIGSLFHGTGLGILDRLGALLLEFTVLFKLATSLAVWSPTVKGRIQGGDLAPSEQAFQGYESQHGHARITTEDLAGIDLQASGIDKKLDEGREFKRRSGHEKKERA